MKNTTRHYTPRTRQNMRRDWKTGSMTLCAVAFFGLAMAQGPPASVLRIDTVNAVLYNEDTADVTKFATDPNVTTPVAIKNFNRAVAVADIQAVNSQPVTGLHTRVAIANIVLRTAPTPGQAIADTMRNAAAVISFEILRSDGTPIGTIMASGFAGGVSPPGSPSNVTGNNFVVTGGTGAFLGSWGQVGVGIRRRVYLCNAQLR